MHTSASNQYDAIEQVIFETGVRIAAIDFNMDTQRMIVRLTTKSELSFPLSAFQLLKDAIVDDLQNFELIADGIGVHWPALDEDLSLKGFLALQLRNIIGGNTQYAMAA